MVFKDLPAVKEHLSSDFLHAGRAKPVLDEATCHELGHNQVWKWSGSWPCHTGIEAPKMTIETETATNITQWVFAKKQSYNGVDLGESSMFSRIDISELGNAICPCKLRKKGWVPTSHARTWPAESLNVQPVKPMFVALVLHLGCFWSEQKSTKNCLVCGFTFCFFSSWVWINATTK